MIKNQGLCTCVEKFPDDQDLDKSSKWYFKSYWVHKSILICGRKKSYFPFQLFVGPDWPGFVGTTFSIIIPTIIFIIFVADKISRIMTYFTVFWFFIVLSSLFYTACSDPGIVFRNDYQLSDVESSPPSQSVNIIECTQCHINRPSTARHCYQCNVCVDQLDHHCFFMGKCIGKKNLYSFYAFVGSIYLHCLFVFGTTAYFIIYVLIVPPIQHAVKG